MEIGWSLCPSAEEEEESGGELKSLCFMVGRFLKDEEKENKIFNWRYSWYIVGAPTTMETETETERLSPSMEMPPDVSPWGAAATMGSRMYVFGGTLYGNDDDPAAKSYVYDTACPAKGWTEAPPVLFQRKCFQALAVDGKLYAFGGDKEACGEVLDPTLDKWEALPQAPEDALRIFAHPVNVQLLDSNGGKHILIHAFFCHALYTYNLNDKSWSLYDADFDAHWPMVAAVDGVLYCFDRNQVCGYDILRRQWFPDPVAGLPEYMIPTYDAAPQYLLHMGGDKLCLVWSEKRLKGIEEQELTIYCTVFSVRCTQSTHGGKAILTGAIESNSRYKAHGFFFDQCLALHLPPRFIMEAQNENVGNKGKKDKKKKKKRKKKKKKKTAAGRSTLTSLTHSEPLGSFQSSA